MIIKSRRIRRAREVAPIVEMRSVAEKAEGKFFLEGSSVGLNWSNLKKQR
jgi:hypothetical protein